VKVSERIEASADAVWGLFRDFGGVDRYAVGLESCTLEGSGIGAVRTIRMGGGIQLQERLESLDDDARRLSYSIVGESPLPADHYLATVEVSEDGDGCQVEWSSTFEPRGVSVEKVAPLIEGIYRGGLAGIRKTLGA
jgi:hypothetical protein